jgi:hypothetical protein
MSAFFRETARRARSTGLVAIALVACGSAPEDTASGPAAPPGSLVPSRTEAVAAMEPLPSLEDAVEEDGDEGGVDEAALLEDPEDPDGEIAYRRSLPPVDPGLAGDWCLDTSRLVREVSHVAHRARVLADRELDDREDPGGIARMTEHERIAIEVRGASVRVRYGSYPDPFGFLPIGAPLREHELPSPTPAPPPTPGARAFPDGEILSVVFVTEPGGALIEHERLDDGEERIERRFERHAGEMIVTQRSVFGESTATLRYRRCGP